MISGFKLLVVLAELLLFAFNGQGLAANILTKALEGFPTKKILHVGDTPQFGLVDIAEIVSVQSVLNLDQAKVLLSQPLDDKNLILVSYSEPGSIAAILSRTLQHNIIYSCWIFTGINQIQLESLITLLMESEKFRGFSPEAKMFLIEDCPGNNADCENGLVVQILGNGPERPVLNICGFLHEGCRLPEAIQEAGNNVNFHGQTMIVSYEDAPPFSIPKEDGSVDGILVNVAKVLGQSLNLTIQFQLFRERYAWATQLENGSWSGNLGDVVNGLIHTSVAAYVPTIERVGVVDFTKIIVTENIGFIVKRPDANAISAQNYVGQFKNNSWTVTGCMILTCFMGLLLLFTIKYNRQKSPGVLISGIETTILAIINKPPRTKLVSASQKIFVLSLFSMTLVLMCYYKANLKAALQIRTMTLPINSLEDIVDSSMKLIVWRGSSIESGYQFAPSGSVRRKIYDDKIAGKESVQDLGGFWPSLKVVEEGWSIFHGAIDAFRMSPDYPCSMIDVKKMRSKNGLTMPFAKESPFFHSVQKAILKMKQTGLIDRLQFALRQTLELKEQKQCEPSVKSLGIGTTFFPFACLVGGIVLAALVTAIEYLQSFCQSGENDLQQLRPLQLRKALHEDIQSLPTEDLEYLLKFVKRNLKKS